MILVSPATPLNQVPAILKSGIDCSKIEHLGKDAPRVGGRIKVIQGIPVIVTPSEGLAEVHVEKGVESEVITPVALPSFIGNHSLTSRPMINIAFAVESHRHVPEEVIVRRVVIQVEVLLLSII